MLLLIAQDSWEMVGKKKSVGKEGTPAENREKRGEREGRGRGGPNRRGRGAIRYQEGVSYWLFISVYLDLLLC